MAKVPVCFTFLDPITCEVMADPVVCEDGFSYDRETIERHFSTQKERDGEGLIQLTSPKTLQVVSELLLPNRYLEQRILEFMESGHADISEDDIADWKERRQQKRKNDRQRKKRQHQAKEEEFSASLISSFTKMGFPEAEVRACLIASKGNPDEAMEFLLDGIPSGIPTSEQQAPAPLPNFYKKLTESNGKTLVNKIEDLVNLVEDIHGMKFLYTMINLSHQLEYIGSAKRKDFVTRSLEKVSKTTACTESIAMFKQLLEKALHDGNIDDLTCKCLDRKAEVTHTSNTPFVKDIWNQFNTLEARVDRLEARVDVLESHAEKHDANIEKLEQVSSDIVLCLRKLQKGIKRQKKVDAVVGMMSAILNAVSFGAAGSAAQGVIGMAVNSIVDFGDVSHIQGVVESFGDVTVKAAFDAGLQVAERYGDEAVYKAAEKGEKTLKGPLYDELFSAAREGNPLFAIAVTANIVNNVHMTTGASSQQAQGLEPLVAASASSLPKALTDATTEEVCKWLSKHGVSGVSLDVLKDQDIDGTFLFEESTDEVKEVLKDGGITAGMNFKIRKAVEEAKAKGFLV